MFEKLKNFILNFSKFQIVFFRIKIQKNESKFNPILFIVIILLLL